MKQLIKYHCLNFLENIVKKPILAKDRILRAYSTNGYDWQIDKKFLYNLIMKDRSIMSYYVSRYQNNLIFRSSLFENNQWKSIFHTSGSFFKLQSNHIELFYGGTVIDNFFYVVRRYAKNSSIHCFKFIKFPQVTKEIKQNWDYPKKLNYVEDISIIKKDNRYFAFVTCNWSKYLTNIGIWVSSNKQNWQFLKTLDIHNDDKTFSLISNPCIIKTTQNNYILYYRKGIQPALNNHIECMVSKDILNWQYHNKCILPNNNQWDNHGIGFPFVYYCNIQNKYVMYFTGFWGKTKNARNTKLQWQNHYQDLCARNIKNTYHKT